MMFRPHKKGVALLPMIIAMSFVVLVVVVSLASLGFVEISIGSAQKRADEAFFVANAGYQDALIRITRNKSYSNTGYDLTVGNGTATIVVELNAPSAGKSRITSTGVVVNSKRKIQVVVTVTTFGKVTVDSFAEIAP